MLSQVCQKVGGIQLNLVGVMGERQVVLDHHSKKKKTNTHLISSMTGLLSERPLKQINLCILFN